MDGNESENTQNSFTFVLIPTSNDTLQEVTKSKAGGLNNDELQKYAKAYFGYHNDSHVHADGLIEITGLDISRPDNNYTFVTIYSDKNAKTKEKPVNKRATSLVSACRHVTKVIYGDVFLGRAFDNKRARW